MNLELSDGTKVPAHYIVCEKCEGRGTTTEHLGVFFQDDIDEDPDFFDDYLSGKFDRPCPRCKGKRVTAASNDPRWIKEQQEREDWEAESQSERNFELGALYGVEAGWYR